jgi:NAD(P)-dependent dehydrogenase (short-subunit alcohol dehydrogenase family)
MSGWTTDQIPDQSGRSVLVTGASSHLHFSGFRPAALRRGWAVFVAGVFGESSAGGHGR